MPVRIDWDKPAEEYGECHCCHSRLPIEFTYEVPPGAYRPDGLQAVDTERLRHLVDIVRSGPCRCDPPGSGEEFCNGGCEIRSQMKALREALEKATGVIERATPLFHPKYLLHTHALLAECKAALALTAEPAPEPAP